MANQKKLLILVDGSERSMQTIQYVAQASPFKDFKLVLYHVFSGVPESYWDMERTNINQESMRQLKAWEKEQKEKIQKFAQAARNALLKEGFVADFQIGDMPDSDCRSAAGERKTPAGY